MRNFVLAIAATAMMASTASAQRTYYRTARTARPARATYYTTARRATPAVSRASYTRTNATGGLAQSKSRIAANRGMRGQHVGGGFGGGRAEGVGFSSVSRQDAIRRSCYWGTRPVKQIGVTRGRDGWYATVIYR